MLHKVFPDKEKAKSIFNMALDRESFISTLKDKNFSTIIAENYYEVIKELSTALLLLNGLKAIGENAHKEIIGSLMDYAGLSDYEVSTLQDLRDRRNKSQYEGRPINPSYLENNKVILLKIIDKLKSIVGDKLKIGTS